MLFPCHPQVFSVPLKESEKQQHTLMGEIETMMYKVEICGVDTGNLKLLKADETRELLLRTKKGDQEAREKLIAGNLRLVLSVIQKYSRRGENMDDLFQVGCIGLIKAIDNFNTDLELRFSTYGVPMNVFWGKNLTKRKFSVIIKSSNPCCP